MRATYTFRQQQQGWQQQNWQQEQANTNPTVTSDQTTTDPSLTNGQTVAQPTMDTSSLSDKYNQIMAQNSQLQNEYNAQRQEIKNEIQSYTAQQNIQQNIQQAQQEQKKLQSAIQANETIIQNYKAGDLSQFASLIQQYQAEGDTSLKAFVNGRLTQGDVHPFSQDGFAMLPLRALGEALNEQVSFSNGVITITRGATTITLTPDSTTAMVNGQEITMSHAPTIMNGHLFVPVRFISEQLGANVNYIPNGNIVAVDDPTAASSTSQTATVPSTGTTVTGAVYTDPSTSTVQ